MYAKYFVYKYRRMDEVQVVPLVPKNM